MKKKKWIIISVILVLVAVAAVLAVVLLRKNSDKKAEGGRKVYVEKVADFNAWQLSGDSRFLGVVESQEMKYVDKVDGRFVKEVYVTEGEMVNEGDDLFVYDTEEMELALRQLELELTSINNSISNANSEINTLVKERDEAPADMKIEYTARIQSLQAEINQYNYDASSKQLEIDRQKAAIENNVVTSPISGTIKKINNGTSQDDYSSENHFISIMEMGDYRIKATTNEMNIHSMSEGMPMIIRSRFDDSRVWTGRISKLDTEPVRNDNDFYYGGGGETATKYNFYIALDDSTDLMLGQHVYVEMDYGQTEIKDGVWIYEYYILEDEGGSYVWAENSKGKIEKRYIELGEFDDYMYEYQVLSGLSEDDYIAYPEDFITEGLVTTHNYEDVIADYMNDGMYDDGMYDDGMYDDGMYDDGMYDDGIMYEDGMYDDGMYDDGMYDDGMYDDGMNNDDMYNDGVMIEEEIIPDEGVTGEPVGYIQGTQGGVA